jgi:tetraacyldisaccharide-1-P 4'-kinase
VRWVDAGSAETRRPLSSIAEMSVGLFTAIARPNRLVNALRRAGVRVVRVVSIADHGPMSARVRSRLTEAVGLDAWIATEKCALRLDDVRGRSLSVPLGILVSDLTLPPDVHAALLALSTARGCTRAIDPRI